MPACRDWALARADLRRSDPTRLTGVVTCSSVREMSEACHTVLHLHLLSAANGRAWLHGCTCEYSIPFQTYPGWSRSGTNQWYILTSLCRHPAIHHPVSFFKKHLTCVFVWAVVRAIHHRCRRRRRRARTATACPPPRRRPAATGCCTRLTRPSPRRRRRHTHQHHRTSGAGAADRGAHQPHVRGGSADGTPWRRGTVTTQCRCSV